MTARRRKPEAERGPRASQDEQEAAGEQRSFAELMADEQIGGENASSSSTPRRAPRTKRKAPRSKSGPITFTRPDEGQPLLGHVAGLQRRVLRQLRAGRPRPQEDIDLHGLTAREAKAELRQALADATSHGLRCVRVIHGRGLGSTPDKGPVLKRRLAEWLTDPAIGGAVLAFAPASPSDGGSGATLLLLRVH